MVLLYSCWRFPAISEASLLKAVVPVGTMPPDAEKTRELNVPRLISLILLIVSLFDVFVASVGSIKGRLAVAGHKIVEHSYIKESTFMQKPCAETSKQTLPSHLEGQFECFPCQWLKIWFKGNIWAYLRG